MNLSVDLTKHNFNRIDFSEAKIIDFYCPYELPKKMEFSIWGATLLLEPEWNHEEKFDSNLLNDIDMYVSGCGVLKIDNLIGGEVEVYVYDNIKKNGLTDTAKNYNGSELLLKRAWPFVKTENTEEYLWECVIQWPFGFCNLRLYCDNGKVTFQFDTGDMVTVHDFIMNPKLYGFNDRNIS